MYLKAIGYKIMSKTNRNNFSVEYRRECAELVLDQGHSIPEAAKAMGIGLSTLSRWVKQLREERQGVTPKSTPMTADQKTIKDLQKKVRKMELQNEILKKAMTLLGSDEWKKYN